MEAGNRCYDDRVPEEVNRRIIDHSSDVLMPYTERSRQNLLAEGIPGRRIYVTGNPILEVIRHYQPQIDAAGIFQDLKIEPGKYFLVTLHRTENVDDPARLGKFAEAFHTLQGAYHLPVIVSTHPHTRLRLRDFGISVKNPEIRLLEPFGFFDFVALEQKARCVLSDSGTVQEECCIFKVPAVTLRDVTERPETLDCGSNILSGADPENPGLRKKRSRASSSVESAVGISGRKCQPNGGKDSHRISPYMTPEFPLVSIITPVFNGAKYLDELIQSVQKQNYPNLEHIIIDDGSTDDGATIAILRKYPQLKWWSRENQGQYATMNEGLEAAQGQYVCFISADDVLMSEAVQSVLKIFQNNPECDGVSGLTRFITWNGLDYPIKYPFQTAPIRFYAYFSHISHCSLYLHRKRLIENNLLFDPSLRYVGDYDWLLKFLPSSVFSRPKYFYLRFVFIRTRHLRDTNRPWRRNISGLLHRIISTRSNIGFIREYTSSSTIMKKCVMRGRKMGFRECINCSSIAFFGISEFMHEKENCNSSPFVFRRRSGIGFPLDDPDAQRSI